MTIDLGNADELLSTTRAVRRRLDLTRPVPREIILDCIRIAQQAPTATNAQTWRWLVVTDPAKRLALAELYRGIAGSSLFGDGQKRAIAAGDTQTARVYDAAQYLSDHLHEIPVHVIPCLVGRPDGPIAQSAAFWASIYPAAWSFNLALRARGLGSVLTTLLLVREQEAAKILGIPDTVTQAALLPVAYTVGADFKPAQRPAPETITYWDTWEGG